MKVPKNICGRMKMNDIPVAAPALFATVAVISPRPTEHIARKIMKIKANTSPRAVPAGWNPNANDRITTIIT